MGADRSALQLAIGCDTSVASVFYKTLDE